MCATQGAQITLPLDLPHCLVLLRSALADNVYMSRLGRAIANTKNLKLSDINRHGEFIVDSTGQADPEQPHVVCLILGLNNRLNFRNQVIDCFTKGPVIHRTFPWLHKNKSALCQE